MEKRDNNFTTKELKILAKDDGPIVPFDTKYDVYVEKLKESMKYHGFDYEKLIAGNGLDDIIHQDLWFDLSNMINILAWKILYERELHKQSIKELREEILDTLQTIRQKTSFSDIDSDINTEIEEGDETDYYDEIKLTSEED